MTTATPRGLIASCTQRATCFVRRSCTWRRRLKVSAMRASFEMPKTSLLGMYAMAICEWWGQHAVSGQVTGTGRNYRAIGEWLTERTNLASEWDQMVFAEAGDIDVANQDHFVMVLRKDSIIDHVYVGQNYLLVFGVCVCAREKKRGTRRTCLPDVLHSLSSSTSRPGRIVLVCEGGLLDQDPPRCTRGRCAPRRRVWFDERHSRQRKH